MSENFLESEIQFQDSDPFPYTSFSDLPLYEQRCLPRYQTFNRAYYHEDGCAIVRTQTTDLSATGVCVYAESEIAVNHQVKLKIYLNESVNFEAEGVIVWKRITPDAYCYAGIEFEGLSEKTRELIRDFTA